MTLRFKSPRHLRRTILILALALIAPLYLFGGDAFAQSAKQLKPTGLTGTVVTAGVELNWNAPEINAGQVTGYKIQRRRPGHGETTLGILVEDTGSTDTTYVDTTATEEGTEYIYRVIARRGNTLSKRSNKLVITWEAAEAVDTDNANSLEFVADTDDDLVSVNAHIAGHEDSVCDDDPQYCLPWVMYLERAVPDPSSIFGSRGVWELRMRPPTHMPGTPEVLSYEYQDRFWTGGSWGDWSAGNFVEYGIGNWVNISLDNATYSCKYAQHRVRFLWTWGGVDHVTDWVDPGGWIYIHHSPCLEEDQNTAN